MDSLAISRLRQAVSEVKFTPQPNERRFPKPRHGEWFLRGPIPGSWLSSAASLNVRALRVALAIWCEVGMRKSVTIRLTAAMRNRFSIGRPGPGLRDLEGAGLVSVDRPPGRLPRITVLEARK